MTSKLKIKRNAMLATKLTPLPEVSLLEASSTTDRQGKSQLYVISSHAAFSSLLPRQQPSRYHNDPASETRVYSHLLGGVLPIFESSRV